MKPSPSIHDIHAAIVSSFGNSQASTTDKMRSFVMLHATDKLVKESASAAVRDGFRAMVTKSKSIDPLLRFLATSLSDVQPDMAKRALTAVNAIFSPCFYKTGKAAKNFSQTLADAFGIETDKDGNVTKRHRLGLLENNVIGLVPVQIRNGSYAAAAGKVVSEYLGISVDDENLPTAAETITQQHAAWLAYCQQHNLDPTTSEPIATTKPKTKVKTKRERAA